MPPGVEVTEPAVGSQPNGVLHLCRRVHLAGDEVEDPGVAADGVVEEEPGLLLGGLPGSSTCPCGTADGNSLREMRCCCPRLHNSW